MTEVVRDLPERHRFVIEVDGTTAGFVTYRAEGEHLALVHTEVSDEYEGRGIGSRLIAGVLQQLDERGTTVLPECPFVRDYLDQHPEWMRLVPAGERARYGLAEPA